ncbi:MULTISPECIES: ABC transporter permease [Kordiimonas]|uniref:ABC transporter permease n=1 Tax=Kordiimonas TaxID=288021 RepID=UPI001FF58AD3|nr:MULTISPECIES: ABC transporter permease [Kordiimonas]MCK0070653.1 ABC transporter permease [Kordiimonas laminariae]UTW60304.1 ABC transporter permease [Kordiimonas sp. SCSIO 12603]
MSIIKCFQIAFIALRLNALRSLLTMLGIIIGIASVIVMVSISDGAQQQIDERINSLGTNMLMVRPGSSFFGGRRGGAGSAPPMTETDVSVLKELNFVEGVSGYLRSSGAMVFSGTNWQAEVAGIHPDYIDVRQWEIEEGRNFTEREVKTGGKVALVGQTIINELFSGNDPIGQRFRIKNIPFTVVGTLKGKGQSSWGQDQDDIVMVPISTHRMRVSGRRSSASVNSVGSISLTVDPGFDISEAEEEIKYVMRDKRKISPGSEDNFSVRNLSEFIEARSATQRTLGVLLAATAAISLVVGGIGIMNIMLVSVTERTKEIGLRMAVGARGIDILNQFLVESVVLCLVGSVIGIGIGFGLTELIGSLGEWPVLIKSTTILIAVGAAAFVGVFFGFYPARRASQLDPIDALRTE